MRVSACMIAKNESGNIKACIESCKRIAGQIILVDTGSEDDTVKIARELGAEVYFFTWRNDFAAAKNFAIDKAHGEWIFFPDADEYILDDTALLLKKEMRRYQKDPKIDALTGFLYNIDTKTKEVRKSATITRVFKNDPRIRYKGMIHEKLVREGSRPMGHIILDKAKIYHTGYSAHMLPQKNERNLQMLLQVEKDGKADASNYYHIAGTLCSMERYGEALDYIEKLENHQDFLFLIRNFNLMPNFFVFKTLTMMRLYEAGRAYSYEEMLAVTAEGMRHYPASYEIAEQRINTMLYWGRLDEALEAYETTIELFRQEEKRTDFSHKRDKSRMFAGMARICQLKGDESTAFDHYVQAVSEDYTFKAGLLGLLELVKSQPAHEIVAFLNRIYDETVPEQAGFLAFAAGNILLPEVFFHYFAVLPQEDTLRYNRYLIYKRLFCEDYGESARLADEQEKRLRAMKGATEEGTEKGPEADKIKELRILRGLADFLDQEKVWLDMTQEEDREVFIGILERLLRLGRIPQAERFLDFMPEQDWDMLLQAADTMKSLLIFDAAADFYQMLLDEAGSGAQTGESPEEGLRVKAAEGLAYCLYRQGQTDTATALCRQLGPDAKMAPQLLKWMGE